MTNIIWRPKDQNHSLITETVICDYINFSTIEDISKKYNISRFIINNILTKNNIPKREQYTENQKCWHTPKKYILTKEQENEICRLYSLGNISANRLGIQFCVPVGVIRRLLLENKIPLISRSMGGKLAHKDTQYRTNNPTIINDVRNLYTSGATLNDIASKYDISIPATVYWLDKMNIQRRSLRDSAKLHKTLQRRIDTLTSKHGVSNPMQIPDVFDRSNKSRYKFKEFEYGGKKFTKLQGYEPQAIVYMVEQMNIPIEDVYHGKQVPHISYNFNNKSKTYFPDLFVPTTNTLYEVKSIYTYNNMLEINKAKRQAAINAGYNHITIIFEQDAKTIHKII